MYDDKTQRATTPNGYPPALERYSARGCGTDRARCAHGNHLSRSALSLAPGLMFVPAPRAAQPNRTQAIGRAGHPLTELRRGLSRARYRSGLIFGSKMLL